MTRRYREVTFRVKDVSDVDGTHHRLVKTVDGWLAPEDDQYIARLSERQARDLLESLEEKLQDPDQ